MNAPLAPAFDHSYARELPGCFVAWQPAPVPAPRLLYLNHPLGEELGLPVGDWDAAAAAELWSGNRLPAGAQPIAQVYAGHQFGGFSPRLGDGRALLLGEVIDRAGRRRDLAFKGSGRTPFARGGDGKAAVGPMLREALLGEAMHALGIPTTRALAVVATGESVVRETVLPGAVLTRVAASHLRVGTFEYFAAQKDSARVRQLADYAIARHDPQLVGQPDRYLRWLHAVAQRQARLVAQWLNVGFIHGVMNTDNMTISGETIDYGPCAFLEAYDPAAVFSSIDSHGRYAFGQQPAIAQWNLARLAECVLPLLADDPEEAVGPASAVIEAFPGWFAQAHLDGLRAKLGLGAAPGSGGAVTAAAAAAEAAAAEDAQLASDWLALLHAGRIDFTLAWRLLADAAIAQPQALLALWSDPAPVQAWLVRWQARCAADDGTLPATAASAAAAARATRMRAVNPWLIARNHRVEEALDAATRDGDLGPFERLLAALQAPFVEDPRHARYAEPAPPHVAAAHRTFCGT